MAVLDRMPWAAKDQVFRRLAKIAEVRNLTKEERLRYDQSLKHYRDSINVMRGAIMEGEEKGRTVGFEKGRAEGRAEGEEIGNRSASLRIAQQLKLMGMTIQDIMKATGLTEEEIKNA